MSDSSALWELTKARIREFYREPGAVFWVFGFPVLMVVGLGLAFRNTPTEAPRVALHQGVPAWVAPALLERGFKVEHVDQSNAREHLARQKSDLLVRPGDAGAESITYEFDAQRSEARLARALTDAALEEARGRTSRIKKKDVAAERQGTRYVDFLLPGVIGLNLMGSSMWGIGYSVVVARKRRLMRRYAASPMRRSHFLGAYALSRLLFLSVELAFLVVFGALAFGVTIQGSLVSYCLVALVGASQFAALSLLIAARIDSIEAANGWLNFAMLPMWLLSGSFFSYERFPEVMQPAIALLPLTALNDALRAIANNGASLWSTWPELLIMTLWGVIGFLIAMKRFKWQ